MKRTFALTGLLCLLASMLSAQTANVAPVIADFGLAGSASMTQIMPFSSDRTVAVGIVKFRARVTDANGNLIKVQAVAGTSSGFVYCNPPKGTTQAYIGIWVDARKRKPGETITCEVLAIDTRGVGVRRTETLTLR